MKNVMKVILMCFMPLVATSANAIVIDGFFGVNGALSATGGSDLSNVTDISLSTVYGTDLSSGDTSNVTFESLGAGGSIVSLTGGALPAGSFLTIEGWSLELTSLTVVDQTTGLLSLEGMGILTSTDGFEPTDAMWTFSTTSMKSYNMTVQTVSAVPVPAAMWLFGSGLIGLIGLARRKA